MEKSQRLRVFFDRLNEAPPASTQAEARTLSDSLLVSVEDEHSGIPNDSKSANTPAALDGRMYPPLDDYEKGSTHTYRRFRARGHVVYYGMNGAIRIDSLHGDVLVDKPGADGRRIDEL